jgi:hypothetical protein
MISHGLRMQPRNEKFRTLSSKAGSNVVESAAILMEFDAAPHERWAQLTPRTRPPLPLGHQRLDPSPRRLAEFC